MRILTLAALAALTVGLIDARTASAATWQCVGPEVACSSAGTPSKAAYKKSATKAQKGSLSARRAAARNNRTAARNNKVAKQAYSGGGSYGGGSSGVASYYWQGQQTASGQRFNPSGMTAAHRTLPFGTKVRVTNQSNGRSVVVTINDRGPFIKGRIIDLSRGAAQVIGMTGAGLARVSVERM
jgi:rare lipoprotein A